MVKKTKEKNKKDKPSVFDVFDTHKFFYTLNHKNMIKGLKVFFIGKEGKEISINLSKIEIGTSPISCNLFDENLKRYRVPFLKIRKVLKGKELVWDNSDIDISNSKTIEAFK